MNSVMLACTLSSASQGAVNDLMGGDSQDGPEDAIIRRKLGSQETLV